METNLAGSQFYSMPVAGQDEEEKDNSNVAKYNRCGRHVKILQAVFKGENNPEDRGLQPSDMSDVDAKKQ